MQEARPFFLLASRLEERIAAGMVISTLFLD